MYFHYPSDSEKTELYQTINEHDHNNTITRDIFFEEEPARKAANTILIQLLKNQILSMRFNFYIWKKYM